MHTTGADVWKNFRLAKRLGKVITSFPMQANGSLKSSHPSLLVLTILRNGFCPGLMNYKMRKEYLLGLGTPKIYGQQVQLEKISGLFFLK